MTPCTADLHLHTTASDGTQTITQLVARAKAIGLSIIAVTDHDIISPELKERTHKRNGIEVITGVELKVDFDGIRGEMLGYFIDPHAPALQKLFSFMGQARRRRMEDMVTRCRELAGAPITMAEVAHRAAGSIGRPHLAQLLVEKGVVETPRQAFEELIGSDKPCYVPTPRPGFREAAQAIHGAGGVTSIPHPCLMDVPDWEAFLSDVKQQGVDGLEVFYPYQKPVEKLAIRPEWILATAKRLGFLLTGGSDDHGIDSVKEELGKMRIACDYVEALRAATRA
jgi:3',5'-nucleoside bisphosphate phosphatase